jgi:hypothetical protein
MESQTRVEYEVIDTETNEQFFTDDHFEALNRFAEEWMVYERHITLGNPSRFVQTEQKVTILWNYNPEFEEEE